MPFFSIIIPTYNRVHFLKIAVESILRQTYQDFELIIIDDGSTDQTKKLVHSLWLLAHKKEYNKEPNNLSLTLNPPPYTLNIRYYYQPNQGPAAARNRGLKEAKGEYICFLDSDDRFTMRKLEVTREYTRKYPSFKIFHTEEIWHSGGKLLPQKKIHSKPDGNVFFRALKLCCISISTCCIHRSVFEDIGIFDESMPVCEDYDFWLRATAKHPIKLIPQYLTIKEGGRNDQQSKKYPALDKYRIYAIEKLLKDNKLSPHQYYLAVEELKKKCAIYIKGAKKRNKTKEVERYNQLLKKFSN